MTKEQQEQVKAKARRMISAQLRVWMADRKMDRFALSEASGLSPDAIYKILRGDRGASADSLTLLAAGLGIQVAVLLMPIEADNGSDDNSQ